VTGQLAAGRLPLGGAAPGLRVTARLPEPAHFWIRYAPRSWEGPERPWLDLAAGRLGRSGRRSPGSPPALGLAPAAEPSGLPAAAMAPAGLATALAAEMAGLPGAAALGLGTAEESPGAAATQEPAATGQPAPTQEPVAWTPAPPLFDDVLYLPPVPERLAAGRDSLAERALAAGTPVLVQLLPGDRTDLQALPPETGAVLVVDLLAALLAGELGRLDAVPERAAAAAWPLLPGIADDPALWDRGCERLAAAGLRRVQALAPALAPGDRRRLAAESGGVAFDALFHRQAPAERDFARVAHRHGLAPFLPRPLPRPPLPRAGNRRVAGALALAAELWLRVGRPVEQAQSLFRAARWLDATAYDVEALSREGNLAVVTALDPLARRVVAESLGGGEPALLAELLADYLG
jgi:hypothetical protein